MQIQSFYFILFLHYFKRLLQKLHYITKVRKNKTTNYINHQKWNVRSDQRSLGFLVGHCHLQLTGVYICKKLQVSYNGERKVKSP